MRVNKRMVQVVEETGVITLSDLTVFRFPTEFSRNWVSLMIKPPGVVILAGSVHRNTVNQVNDYHTRNNLTGVHKVKMIFDSDSWLIRSLTETGNRTGE